MTPIIVSASPTRRIHKLPEGSTEFVQLPNAIFQDRTIQAFDIAVLAYLLSKPPEWKVQMTDVKEQFNCHRATVSRSFNRLEDAGYMKHQKHKDERGMWLHQYEVFASPCRTGATRVNAVTPSNLAVSQTHVASPCRTGATYKKEELSRNIYKERNTNNSSSTNNLSVDLPRCTSTAQASVPTPHTALPKYQKVTSTDLIIQYGLQAYNEAWAKTLAQPGIEHQLKYAKACLVRTGATPRELPRVALFKQYGEDRVRKAAEALLSERGVEVGNDITEFSGDWWGRLNGREKDFFEEVWMPQHGIGHIIVDVESAYWAVVAGRLQEQEEAAA
jgi:Iron dependent repressor, N-terminal DNA binding domain.